MANAYPIAEGVWRWPTGGPDDCAPLTGEPDVTIVVNAFGHDVLTEQRLHAIARGHLPRTPGTWTYRAYQRQPSSVGVIMSSFLNGLKSVAAELEAEGHALASKLTGLVGEAEKIIEGIAGELTPAISEIKTQLTEDGVKLSAEALDDLKELSGEGFTDLKGAFATLEAAVKALLGQAPAAPAEPAAPSA